MQQSKLIVYVAFDPGTLTASVSAGEYRWCFAGIDQVQQMVEGLDRDGIICVGHGIRRWIWVLRAIRQGIDYEPVLNSTKPWTVVSDKSIKTFYDIADNDSIAEIQAFAGFPVDSSVKAVRETVIAVMKQKFGDFEARSYLAEKYGDDSLYSLSVSSLAARVLKAKAPSTPWSIEERELPDIPVATSEAGLRDTIARGSGEAKMGNGEIVIKVGNGGLHGARANYSSSGKTVVVVDVDSMYPSLMLRYDLLPRSASVDIYKAILNERLAAKAAGDSVKANALKLVLNAAYGAMRCDYSPLFDPSRAELVCKFGQVLMSRLAALASTEAELVQVNTDGVIVAVDCGEVGVEHVRNWVQMWEEETGLTCSIDVYDDIYQRDVNTYILVKDGEVKKEKGALAANDKLHNSANIVAKAVQAELLKKRKIEEVVRDCNELLDFQIAFRTTTALPFFAADGKQIPDAALRVFAATDMDEDAVRITRIRDDHTTCACAGCPERVIVWRGAAERFDINRVNKNWYVNAAMELLDSIVRSEEKKKVTTAANLSKPEIICDFDW